MDFILRAIPSRAILTSVLATFGLLVASSAFGQGGTITGTVSVTGVKTPENVVVYLPRVPGEYPPATKPVLMDTKQLVFNPVVLPIVKGTTVVYSNRDRVKHNVTWPESANGAYQPKTLGTWGKDEFREFTYEHEGVVAIGCKVHPEMAAYILVLQNPFFAVVGEDGTFQIEYIPAGEHELKTWYPNRRRLKSQTKLIKVTDGETTVQDFSLSRR